MGSHRRDEERRSKRSSRHEEERREHRSSRSSRSSRRDESKDRDSRDHHRDRDHHRREKRQRHRKERSRADSESDEEQREVKRWKPDASESEEEGRSEERRKRRSKSREEEQQENGRWKREASAEKREASEGEGNNNVNNDRRRRASSMDRHKREGSERRKDEAPPKKEEPLAEPLSASEEREAELKKLDEEAEKRRKRIEEWRKKRQEELKLTAEEPKETVDGKKWTLDNESDDEETQNADASAMQVEEVDPLDAYMNNMVMPEVEKLEDESQKQLLAGTGTQNGRLVRREPGGSDDSDEELEEDEEEAEDDDFLKKKSKAEKLAAIDHSKVSYQPFRKSFYIEVKELARMTGKEVADYRKELEVKASGSDVPKPIKGWNQAGLSNKVLEVIRKAGFAAPLPIQAQALPIIMSGRDCIGIAKTGSGKTLAFVLPMLRHVANQEALQQGDGPIALIMAPTRELVQQIYSDVKRFTKVLGLGCVPVYGGSGVAQQISDLKRGTEVVVCTPGRMIDVLCTSAGKITNLRRVTYLVLDEADRMFDLGFEPQITRIVQNIRPDCQTVLFSATFPRQVELLARKVLTTPVEIQVGGRNVVNKDISQTVELRPECERFKRLLELLGEWCERGKVLVFVHSQDKCDALFRDLIRAGYPCLSLHGGKEQTDRESTISDFKNNVCSLLVATSVAARGLDVQDLELVVNFDVPNHYEDYVHRVGRTGRAGRKGTAVTFIGPEEENYASDLVKALELSGQAVPDDLRSMAESFKAKGGKAHGSGYGGRGHKFNMEEDEALKVARKAQFGYEDEQQQEQDHLDSAAAAAAAAASSSNAAAAGGLDPESILAKAKAAASDAAARALAKAATFNLQHNLAKISADHYEDTLEINDLPQHARYQVTKREALQRISESTGAAVAIRGQYIAPGRNPPPGERKLYLFIEGDSEVAVRRAKMEIRAILDDSRTSIPAYGSTASTGKYHVL